jgi:hypothetical protein
VSRALQTFLQSFVFSVRRPIAHALSPSGRTDDARLSAPSQVSQKTRWSRQGAKIAKENPPLFSWRSLRLGETRFLLLWLIHTFSDSATGAIVRQARTHCLRKFSIQLPSRRLGALTTKSQFANQTASRGVESFVLARAQTHTPRRNRPGAPLRLLVLDKPFCPDVSMTYGFRDRN